MVEIDHTDDGTEQESEQWYVAPPCVAFDMGQKGWPAVFVTHRVADSVSDYVDMGGADPRDFTNNQLIGVQETDAIFRCTYLTDSPLSDPKTSYPVPESRLRRFRDYTATPIDNDVAGGYKHPAEHVRCSFMEDLFHVAFAEHGTDCPTPEQVKGLFVATGLSPHDIDDAYEVAKAYHEELTDDVAVDDSGVELTRVGDTDPVKTVSDTDGGDDTDGELGDFDPDA